MAPKIKHAKGVLIISLLILVMSAYCAVQGFMDDSLYGNVIETGVFKMAYMAGTVAQDMITITASAAMVILITLYCKSKDIRFFISIIGLLSFYFYAYGVYVISALYTSLYIVYVIIFTLSMIGMILGISGFTGEKVERLLLLKWIRITSGALLLLIVCVFVPMWIVSMVPYTQNHTIPDFYAVFILDLCIVMPFFIAVIYMLIRDFKVSYIYLGIALLKTFTLILSVLIGEITFPAHGFEIDMAMIVVYGTITVISLLLLVFYFAGLKYSSGSNKT